MAVEIPLHRREDGPQPRPDASPPALVVTGRRRYAGGAWGPASDDRVVVETPLQIRVQSDTADRLVTVTMRTPGHDRELAAGLLRAEGVIRGPGEIAGVYPCGDDARTVRVRLRERVEPRLDGIARSFGSTAACGACGKSSIDAVYANVPAGVTAAGSLAVAPALLCSLPERLRAAQDVFASTGGLHAVAAFGADGTCDGVYEDVGRHNAFDKLYGHALLVGRDDLADRIVVLSGRAGFELLQKAAVAHVPIVAAIGAPSSLAIELAARAGITLVGFLRPTGFNVYTVPARIGGASGA